MRIAQVSPLEESVPPRTYGGTERVIAYLADEFISLGHDVTLFASGDSHSAARLIAVCPEALRSTRHCQDKLALHIVEIKNVLDRIHEFDIIHFHNDYIHFPSMSRVRKPFLTTLHGRQDIPELKALYSVFDQVPLVSISHAQRKPLPMARWVGNVYHGLPTHLLEFHRDKGSYLAFLGRISPEKRVDRAIEIAKACGVPLKIAAKVDTADRPYFDREIKKLLDHPLIEFIGEIDEKHKNSFLGQAMALLFPIDWPEPFGLVMIEAMACGTPVIAFRNGSVDEVIRDGLSGFIVDSVPGGVAAVHRLDEISRETCRQEFLQRFTAEQMAQGYLAIYETLLAEAADQKFYPLSRHQPSPKVQHL